MKTHPEESYKAREKKIKFYDQDSSVKKCFGKNSFIFLRSVNYFQGVTQSTNTPLKFPHCVYVQIFP